MSALIYETIRYSALAETGPVLLLLHGVGSNEKNMIPLAEVADERFTVISVRAPLGMGQESYAWFPVRFTDQGPILDPVQAERSRVLLSTFIEDCRLSNGVRPVFLLGFSQGAIMAALCSVTLPEAVRGAVCMSGRFPAEFESAIASPERLGSTRLLITHGTEDTTLPVRLGRTMRDLLKEKGVPLEYREYAAGHTVTNEMIADVRHWLSSQLTDLERSGTMGT